MATANIILTFAQICGYTALALNCFVLTILIIRDTTERNRKRKRNGRHSRR